MPKILAILVLCCFLSAASNAQNKFSAYLLGQYTKTINDYTKGNNPWGMGLSVHAYMNNRSWFKPMIEISADAYLADDKVFRANPDGSWPTTDNTVGSMVNLFAGCMIQPTKQVYVSMTAGPGFVSGQTLLGIKPTLGFYFSKDQKWMTTLSYINIYNRIDDYDFSSWSLGVGFRLF